METSIFLGKLIGAACLTIGFSVLLNPKYYKKILKEKSIYYLGGLIALVAGYSIVIHHNIWELSWRVIITIFGFIAVVKGIILLIFPDQMSDISKKILKKKFIFTISAIFYISIGIILGYYTCLA